MLLGIAVTRTLNRKNSDWWTINQNQKLTVSIDHRTLQKILWILCRQRVPTLKFVFRRISKRRAKDRMETDRRYRARLLSFWPKTINVFINYCLSYEWLLYNCQFDIFSLRPLEDIRNLSKSNRNKCLRSLLNFSEKKW